MEHRAPLCQPIPCDPKTPGFPLRPLRRRHGAGRELAGPFFIWLAIVPAEIEPDGGNTASFDDGSSGIALELPFFRLKEEKAGEFLEKGIYHLNAHNYVSAREYFYRSLDAKPDFPLARKLLGDTYFFAGDCESALEQSEALREAGGSDAGA